MLFDYYFRRQGTLPTNFYLALVTAAAAPGPDTNILSDLTQIAAGNGYASGGYQLTPNTTDFDVMTEDDALDKAILQIKNIVWTAAGGAIPASGGAARYVVLTDDNVTVNSRQVIKYWDRGGDKTAAKGTTLTLVDLEMDLIE